MQIEHPTQCHDNTEQKGSQSSLFADISELVQFQSMKKKMSLRFLSFIECLYSLSVSPLLVRFIHLYFILFYLTCWVHLCLVFSKILTCLRHATMMKSAMWTLILRSSEVGFACAWIFQASSSSTSLAREERLRRNWRQKPEHRSSFPELARREK